MAVTTTRYIRKPLHVDAVRITGRNIDEVAAWCQGNVLWEETPGGNGTGKKYIRVRVHQPKNVRQTKAFVGDWLLYTDKGYKVYTHKAFLLSFDEVPLQDSGDVITLGPECFVAADGSVLNWKGENYVPQEKPGNVVGSEELEFVPATPEGIAEAVAENTTAAAEEETGGAEDEASGSDEEREAA